MASLKYKRYRIDIETLEWIPEKRYSLPLPIVKFTLLIIPEFIIGYFLKKISEGFQGKIEGINSKEFIWIVYEICHEIVETNNITPNPASTIIEIREEKQKSVLLVE